jgi:hypothetical protein
MTREAVTPADGHRASFAAPDEAAAIAKAI